MPSLKRVAALSMGLAALNAWIAWRLFTTEYLDEMNSLAGIYIGFARYAAAHWPHLSWWPLWFCGMPFANAYQPAFHLAVAGFSALSGLSAARSYHFLTGCAYCLGPVTLFWLVSRLGRNVWAGFAAGLLYSLASPSAWLAGAISQDLGGPFFPLRLQVAVRYADTPHMAGLALVPLAILALDYALTRRTFAGYALAVSAFAAVPLTNIPAAMVLAMAAIAYGLACGAEDWPRRWAVMAAIAVAAYLPIGPALPPSTIHTMLANTQGMEPENAFGLRHLAALPVLAALTAGLVWLSGRMALPRALRFFILLSFFAGAITLGNYWFDWTLIAQPRRFEHALDLGTTGAAVLLGQWALAKWKRWRHPALACFAAFCIFQVYNCRAYARSLLKPIEITSRSEYKIARWLDRNSPGGRAFLLGSSAFWLNAFTDVPQVAGCCGQGELQKGSAIAYYQVGSDDGAAGREVEVSQIWLEALGATTIAVTGPRSTDEYRDYHHPWKFQGRLRELWREGDDAIYEVPRLSPSLAHVVEARDLVSRMPVNGIDLAPLLPYVAAIEDPAKPRLEERWASPSEAVLQGSLRPEDRIGVQVAYHPGWHASVNGAGRVVAADGLGFLTIAPRCSGECAVRLFYDGGAEMRCMWWLCLPAALAGAAGPIVEGAKRRMRNRRAISRAIAAAPGR
jgi:hypothetical protein